MSYRSLSTEQVATLSPHLVGLMHGIEKEGLRIDPQNHVAQTPHAAALGSTLTHPSITTDYSESLLEFITPKLPRLRDSFNYLADLHAYTLRNIGDERVWPASMPPRLQGEESIPIANYGTSNIGTMKHVYRQGLGVRYGRVMQSIAGIHFNFSLPDEFWQQFYELMGDQRSLQDFKSAQYFCLIRNFQRYSWILHYLFGASPVLDASFLEGRDHTLQQFLPETFGLEYATSLRMSDLGYQNLAQKQLHVSYCSLDDYVKSLGKAVHQSYPPYKKIGLQKDGRFIQLNANILQLENEFYSDIRPKRVTESGEKPIAALQSRGVEYIEVRILDINPYLPNGIDLAQGRFLDAFLLHCLLAECPKTVTTTCVEPRTNLTNAIRHGRDPKLQLIEDGVNMPFVQVAQQLMQEVESTATLLDNAFSSKDYSSAVRLQTEKVNNVELTPSAAIMKEVQGGKEFVDLVSDLADQHKAHFLAHSHQYLSDADMQNLAQQSLAQQTALEESDSVDFAAFLRAYNEPD